MLKIESQHALILSRQRYSEHSFLVSILTSEYGRYCGILKTKNPPCIGSFGAFRWQARIPQQLGTTYWESYKNTSALYIHDRGRFLCLSCICTLLHKLLEERQEYTIFTHNTFSFIDNLSHESYLKNYIIWEMNLLETIGFGLDLTQCAGGGNKKNLAFISPKTGRAVSFEKGLPYKDKLLKLPKFILNNSHETSSEDILDGFLLTGFFLQKSGLLKELPLDRILLQENILLKDG